MTTDMVHRSGFLSIFAYHHALTDVLARLSGGSDGGEGAAHEADLAEVNYYPLPLAAAGPSSSAPILVSRIPLEPLQTPFDASLASSEETWVGTFVLLAINSYLKPLPGGNALPVASHLVYLYGVK